MEIGFQPSDVTYQNIEMGKRTAGTTVTSLIDRNSRRTFGDKILGHMLVALSVLAHPMNNPNDKSWCRIAAPTTRHDRRL
jgi:hypothetical protein